MLSSLDPYTEESDSNPRNSLSNFSTTSGYYGNTYALCLNTKKATYLVYKDSEREQGDSVQYAIVGRRRLV